MRFWEIYLHLNEQTLCTQFALVVKSIELQFLSTNSNSFVVVILQLCRLSYDDLTIVADSELDIIILLLSGADVLEM